MYKEISSLVFQRFSMSLMLFISVLCATFLQGVGVALIAPLIESTNASADASFFAKALSEIFNVLGAKVDVVNILFFALSLTFISAIFIIISTCIQKKIQFNFETDQKKRLFELITNVDCSFLSTLDYGNVAQVVQQETRLSSQLIDYFVRVVSGFCQVAIYFMLLLLVSSKMTVFVVVSLSIAFILMRFFYLNAKYLGLEIGKLNDRILSNILTVLGGYKTIKSYLAYIPLKLGHESFLDRYRRKNERLSVIEASLSAVFEPLAFLIIILGYFVYQYTVAELFVFLAAIIKLYASIREVQNVHYKMSYHYAALHRISVLEERLVENQYDYSGDVQKDQLFENKIEIKEVSFNYVPGVDVLKNINIKVNKGEKVAFVGRSGSGKSTLVDLLMRFNAPSAGEIYIDNILLDVIDYASFMSKVGYVSQESFMLNATIRENIDLYRGLSQEDILNAAKKANVMEFVESLDNGIETVIGESGKSLSGGQRQRIALARALAGNPQILILDEATSALDNESEKIVQSAIDNISGTVTVFVIAHRLSTVKSVDVIYVLESGLIVESGSYDELSSIDGNFKQLLEAGGM